jgi:hypothetical protein
MRYLIFILLFVSSFAMSVSSQPRPVENDDAARLAAKAPASFEAKYQGGMFGFKEKEEGTLKFDDANERIVFFGKNGKEKFSIPYKSMTMVYPNSDSATSTTGNVVSHIPLPGAGLASLMKEKRRYLVIQFEDEEVDMLGSVNFRVEDRDTLESVIHALGTKGKMKQRGDAYYRGKSKV